MRIANRGSLAVGVDVGGTNTKIAAVTPAGKIAREQSLPSEVSAGPAKFVERVSGLIAGWRKEGLNIQALGLGLAGDVDGPAGTLRFTPNLRGWDGFKFKDAFARRLRLRANVENDANAAVWGGFVVELRSKPKHVVGITLGTGVGGGLVLDGRLYRGATGSAGEIGHNVVESGGAICNCGSRGCLEAYAGSYGIVRLAREAVEKDAAHGSVLKRLCPDLSKLSPRDLSAAAEQGDEAARAVWERVGSLLGVGISNLVLILNPECILILGGVSRAGHWILDPLQRVLAAKPFRTPFSAVELRLADNPNAGCVGAGLLAFEKEPR